MGEDDGISLWRDGSGRWRGGAVLTSPLRIVCATCCFSMFTALSCALTVGLRGIGLHAAAGGQLEIAIPADGERRPAPCLQNIQRHAAAVQAQIDRRCGSWDTAAVACRIPRSVNALSSVILSVDAVALSLSEGRRTSIRLKSPPRRSASRYRSTPPAAVFHQLKLAAIAIESGNLPWEGRVHIDDQVAAGAEFFSVRLCSRAGSGVIHSGFQFAGSVYPARRRRCRRAPARYRRAASCRRFAPCRPPSARRTGAGQYRVKIRHSRSGRKVQRAVDKFAGIHRQRAVLLCQPP